MPKIAIKNAGDVRALKAQRRTDYTDSTFAEGEFGVRVTPAGRKTFFVRYRIAGKRQRMPLGTFPSLSLAEARRRAREALSQVVLGEDPQHQRREAMAAKTTLAGFYAERFAPLYIDSEEGLRASSRDFYRWAFSKHILPSALARVPCEDLTRPHFEQFVSALASTKLSRASLDAVLRALRRIVNLCHDEGLCDKKLMKGLGKLYRRKKAGKGPDPLTAKEAEALLTAARGLFGSQVYYFALAALLHAGMRPGELRALKWADLDLEGCTARVRRNFSHGEMNRPKTERGRRTLDLSDFLAGELKRWKALLREQCLADGVTVPEWAFPGPQGGMLNVKNLGRRQLRDVCEKAEIRRISLYQLRDTFASLLLSAGVDLGYVSQALGHEDISVTVKSYGKYLPGSGREALAKLPCPAKPAEVVKIG